MNFQLDVQAAQGFREGQLTDQLEYEKMFQREKQNEFIEIAAQEFMTQIKDEDLSEYYALFKDKDNAHTLLLWILSLVGSPLNDWKMFKGKREIEFSSLIKAMVKHNLFNIIEDYSKKLQAAVKIIDTLDNILFEITETVDGLIVISYINFELPEELKQSLKGTKLPMIELPKKWKTYQSGGYLLSENKPTLNKGEAEQPQKVLDVLNMLQENEYKLAPDNSQVDYRKFLRESMLKKGRSEEVAREVSEQKAHSAAYAWYQIQDKSFWFEWKFDMRGRMYNTGYDVHLQSDKYMKGTMVPQNAQALTDRGRYWLKVDLANTWGDDKLTFDERVKGFPAYFMEKDHMKAESPTEFRNAKRAIQKTIHNEEVPHLMYLDASNQALQLYGVLTRDKVTASLCNLANGNEIADAYQILADSINQKIFEATGTKGDLTRTNCKKALMTTMYGKVDAASEILANRYPGISKQEALQQLSEEFNLQMNEDSEKSEFYKIFKEALYAIAPLAVETMQIIQSLSSSHVATYRWTLPDGFNVKYDVKEKVNDIVEGTLTKSKKYYRISFMKKVYQASEDNRGLPANIIHSIDGYLARQVVRRMKAQGKFITTIHDAFGVHPNDADLLREVYLDEIVKISKTNLLQDILDQVAKQVGVISPKVPVANTLTEEDMKNSVYYLS